MISSLANSVLFMALVTTSVIVAVLYLKLKRFEAHQAEYTRALEGTAGALLAAEGAVRSFGSESKETLSALGQRIDEAKILMAEMDALAARQKLSA
jgi:uncharacterized protein (UPF0333 family)